MISFKCKGLGVFFVPLIYLFIFFPRVYSLFVSSYSVCCGCVFPAKGLHGVLVIHSFVFFYPQVLALHQIPMVVTLKNTSLGWVCPLQFVHFEGFVFILNLLLMQYCFPSFRHDGPT